MKDSVIDRISQKPQEHKPDDMLMKHDIAIKQLETRLNSLENLVNEIHNQVPVYWEVIDNE